MSALAAMLLALVLPTWWSDTNSHAASARGAAAYAKRQYAAAADAFRRAHALAPSPREAFNLGTAEIAAGAREQGSARLAEALPDRSLRADALFNRGNSALAAKAFDHAIGDYIAALKTNPAHAAAKRNLEIALARRDAARRDAAARKPDQEGKSKQQAQQQPGPKEPPQPTRGKADLEALLRSVQQQEQEELRRMKGRAAEGKVGW